MYIYIYIWISIVCAGGKKTWRICVRTLSLPARVVGNHVSRRSCMSRACQSAASQAALAAVQELRPESRLERLTRQKYPNSVRPSGWTYRYFSYPVHSWTWQQKTRNRRPRGNHCKSEIVKQICVKKKLLKSLIPLPQTIWATRSRKLFTSDVLDLKILERPKTKFLF